MATGFPLSLETHDGVPGLRATGFGTPKSDASPQVLHVPPRRVIPIVFLPGIMGSNLVLNEAGMTRLGRTTAKDASRNIAWRPDNIGVGNVLATSNVSAAERQLILDPAMTAVDVYNDDPKTQRSKLDGDGRHANIKLAPDLDTPLLRDDPPGLPNGRTAAQKARARGWGEVFFKSYGTLLQRVESRLQRTFSGGRLGPGWLAVIGADPVRWGIDPSTPQAPLSEADLRAITKDTFFPVHAVGYNWLVSNRTNAEQVAERIRKILNAYRQGPARKFECPGVIVVTHSMGGLVGRALVHPKMGGLQDEVLGVVHGVQPVNGAAAGYTRMRAGFEDPGLMTRNFEDSIVAKIAGNYGDEVTAVLASSPGGLQLLPSKAYGNGWLRVRHEGKELLRLPVKGDPYEEIYKLRGKWYGLIPEEDWVNPAGRSKREGGNTIEMTHERLDVAQAFHDDLGGHYHPQTYAHYGADPLHRTFGNVTWQIRSKRRDFAGWHDWPIAHNFRQGTLLLDEAAMTPMSSTDPGWMQVTSDTMAVLDPPDEAGDQTVPMRSADQQLHSSKCKAVFRQMGYDHQGSYQNETVLEATLFSILKIAQRMQLP